MDLNGFNSELYFFVALCVFPKNIILLPVCVILTVFEEDTDPDHQEMRTKF